MGPVKDRKRVFFICAWYPNKYRPAEGLFLKNMAEAIGDYNDVSVFYTCEDDSVVEGQFELHNTENGVDTTIIYHKPVRSGIRAIDIILNSVKEMILMAGAVSREFSVRRPDIFHINIVSLHMLTAWYYKLLYNIPFVYSEHWDIPIRVRFGLMKRWLPWRIGMKACSMFASKVIVCSQAMKSSFEYYKLSHNVDIISNVVDIQETDFQDDIRNGGKKVLVHISSLDPAQKNVYGMIDGIAQVAAVRSDFELHVLGKGKALPALKEYTQSLGLLDKSVFYHGYISEEEKHYWIKRSIAHVIFSNFEGQSVVTGESLRYGRPVIATRCGGPEDFVNDTNGILIAPRDIDGLAGAVTTMLDHYQRYLPALIRRDSERIFSSEIVGEKHHELYRSILGW